MLQTDFADLGSRRPEYPQHQALSYIPLSSTRQGLASPAIHAAIPGLHRRELGPNYAESMSNIPTL